MAFADSSETRVAFVEEATFGLTPDLPPFQQLRVTSESLGLAVQNVISDEIRPDAAIKSEVSDTPPTRAQFMGLHVKAMVVDRERAYIGSMNLDPRSARINSEMGVVIESPGLAEEILQRGCQPVVATQDLRSDRAAELLRGCFGEAYRPGRGFFHTHRG